jgi:oxygen-independent coproporphyrinogen-3 oxidase
VLATTSLRPIGAARLAANNQEHSRRRSALNTPPSIPLPQSPARERPDARAALAHAHPPARSLYIHTPFCVHKCHYCDFYSFVDNNDQQEAFTQRLIDELAFLAPHARGEPLRTIFVGGGTPSLLRPELWRRILHALDRHFDLAAIRASQPDSEFTVECNPESTSPALLEVLVAGGVSRVSVGAQSFNPRHLATLERRHNPDNVPKALDTARAAGVQRVSLDLIFAVPGQTLSEWEQDLRTALSLGTTHLSCYNLTYEPNTAMTVRLRKGEFTPLDEETEAAMFERTLELLAPHGLARYEVSNYARPGHESRHNLAYWRQEQWLAAGPSASGHLWAGPDRRAGSHRWKNQPRLMDYLASAGPSPIADHEPPDPARAVRERLMTGVRLAEGLPAEELLADAEHAHTGSAQRLRHEVDRCIRRGWLRDEAGRWSITPAGWLVADHVAAELMGAVGE